MGKNTKSDKKCELCIHENACQAWNVGVIHNMDATNCVNYETLKESNAYFLGVRSCEDDAYSRGCLAGIEAGKNDIEENANSESFVVDADGQEVMETGNKATPDFAK